MTDINEQIAEARAAITAAETPEELRTAKTRLLGLQMSMQDSSPIQFVEAARQAQNQAHRDRQQQLTRNREQAEADRLRRNNPLN